MPSCRLRDACRPKGWGLLRVPPTAPALPLQPLNEIMGKSDPGKTRTNELQSAIESIQRGKFGKAEKILLQITASDPKNFNANHMLGIVSTELNKFEQAEKFFKTSLAINATNPSIYKNYGFFLTKAKQFDRAIEQLKIGRASCRERVKIQVDE